MLGKFVLHSKDIPERLLLLLLSRLYQHSSIKNLNCLLGSFLMLCGYKVH